MEQLDVDLNKVDNLPVVAVIKSQAGLQSVTMKLQTVEGVTEYKTVTEFFNPNSYSLSENLQYIQEDQTEFQTALNEMSSQAATAAKRIQYDTACRTFLSATQWNQISPSLIREVNAAIGAAQLGDSMLAEIAFVSDLVNWSSLFLPSQLAEMQQAMPEKRELVPLGIYTPGKPRNASYFVFGYRYYIGRDRDAALFLSVELTGAGSQLPISQIPGCRFILTDG